MEPYWQRPDRTREMMREGADTWPKIILDSDCREADREWCREQGWTLIVEPKPAVLHPDLFGGQTAIKDSEEF